MAALESGSPGSQSPQRSARTGTHSTNGTLLGISLQLAWRNLWRNKKRSLIMLAAISLGAWAMIFMPSLMRGMLNDSLQRSFDALPGQVQAHQKNYRLDSSIESSFLVPGAEQQALLSEAPVTHWVARIKLPAVLNSERESRAVQLIGLNYQRETQLDLKLVAGHWPADNSEMGLVIGSKLAERLETGLGKRVVLMSQGADGELAERGFRIVALYRSELGAGDERVIYLGLDAAQRFLKMPGKISELAFWGGADADSVADKHSETALLNYVRSVLDKQLEVLPWYELDPYLASMMGMLDAMIVIWILVVFIAMGFGLANTLLMAIFERVRELGLMIALGMPRAMVLVQLLLESLFMLMIGLAVGNALALLCVFAFRDGIDLSAFADAMAMAGVGSRLYPNLQFTDVALANVTVLVLGLATSLLPAWRASHYDPVQALSKD
ncbi:ABC transporter permease [Agaribacterium haliotis]|uniref:ABC transporter permease n=1 Tax=Agaribacterium haliotis TaxID=2013869 RepID=UPI000BB589DE|nr:FtsX-like permease family protein [Agaribacterium haliotis]